MNKFLVVARPAKPLPEGVNVQGCIQHLEELRKKRGAEVFTLVEDDGYGFVILIDVENHDELMAELFKNPLGRWGTYQVFALGTLEGELRAMEAVGFEFNVSHRSS